jgi:hypothetical protein
MSFIVWYTQSCYNLEGCVWFLLSLSHFQRISEINDLLYNTFNRVVKYLQKMPKCIRLSNLGTPTYMSGIILKAMVGFLLSLSSVLQRLLRVQ